MSEGRERLAAMLGLDKAPASPPVDNDGDEDAEEGAADYEEAELAAAEDVSEALKGSDPKRVRDSLKRFIEICKG